jgi:hypothetical protein
MGKTQVAAYREELERIAAVLSEAGCHAEVLGRDRDGFLYALKAPRSIELKRFAGTIRVEFWQAPVPEPVRREEFSDYGEAGRAVEHWLLHGE